MGMGNKIWVILSLVLLSTACNFRKEKISLTYISTEDIDFAFIKTNILQTKCLTCHSSAIQSGGISLESFQELTDQELIVPFRSSSSLLYQSVAKNLMPKNPVPPLSNQEKDILARWIDFGAPEVKGILPKPDSSKKAEPKFSWIKNNVLDLRCLRCHDSRGGTKVRGATDFSTHKNLLASEGFELKPVEPGDPENSSLYTAVESGEMPRPKGNKLPEEQIKAIYDWIKNGALNN